MSFPTAYCVKNPAVIDSKMLQKSCEQLESNDCDTCPKCNEHGEVCGSGEAPLVSRIYLLVISILNAITCSKVTPPRPFLRGCSGIGVKACRRGC